ncbi:MAG: hypothetical protein ACK4GT_09660 [Pararhodobacter sp.]
MFTTNKTLSLVLMLGMAAGSTAAFAQSTNTDAGIQAAPGEGAPVVGTNLQANAGAAQPLASTEVLGGAEVEGPDGQVVGIISVLQPADADGNQLVVIAPTDAGGRSVEIPLTDLQIEANAEGGLERVTTIHTAADLSALPQIQM